MRSPIGTTTADTSIPAPSSGRNTVETPREAPLLQAARLLAQEQRHQALLHRAEEALLLDLALLESLTLLLAAGLAQSLEAQQVAQEGHQGPSLAQRSLALRARATTRLMRRISQAKAPRATTD